MAEITSEGKPVLKIALPFGGVRQALDPYFEPDFVDQLGIKAYDMAGNTGGFETILIGDLNRSEYRCAQYVFVTKQEPWAKEDEPIPVFKNPMEFFRNKGYRALVENETPSTGDIITYGFLQQTDPLFKLVHMGIVDDKSIVSKFNEGHVFRHSREAVPHHFGTHTLFFRK